MQIYFVNDGKPCKAKNDIINSYIEPRYRLVVAEDVYGDCIQQGDEVQFKVNNAQIVVAYAGLNNESLEHLFNVWIKTPARVRYRLVTLDELKLLLDIILISSD
ncbi:MAG: hypothetical protein N2385_14570, partial [Chloroflexus sp.]|nr:hypothetical protein [Chloroflexus sp.]